MRHRKRRSVMDWVQLFQELRDEPRKLTSQIRYTHSMRSFWANEERAMLAAIKVLQRQKERHAKQAD